MSYQKLEIWQLAHQLSIDIHEMTIILSNVENREDYNKLIQSIKSSKSKIQEGYYNRKFNDVYSVYVRFLMFALNSNEETVNRLEHLYEPDYSINEVWVKNLSNALEALREEINVFLKTIEEKHQCLK